jgi:outer membrane protein TolC
MQAASRIAAKSGYYLSWTQLPAIKPSAEVGLQLRTSQATLRLLSANGTAQSEALSLLLARAQGGLSTTVDIVEQRRQLASTQAQIPPLEAQIEVARH